MDDGGRPRVSAILPAHNAESHLRACIESVLGQTYTQLELIVVDDGSTDGTGAIVAEYAQRDQRVLPLYQSNRGVAAARNRAIAAARGRYIAPIDADDIWFPDKIARQVEALEPAGPHVGLAYAWSVRIDERGCRYPESRPRPHLSGWVYPAFVYRNFCSASAPLIRRDCLAAVGGYDPELRARGGEGCEDLDLLLRLAARFAFALVPEYLLGYRQRAGSMSSNTAAMERSFDMVMARALERAPALPARIWRWSRSEFYLHLMSGALRQDAHAEVLRYLALALRYDPSLLGVPYLHRHGLHALLRLACRARPAPRVQTRRAEEVGSSGPSMAGRWRERVRQARIEFVSRWGNEHGLGGLRPVATVDGPQPRHAVAPLRAPGGDLAFAAIDSEQRPNREGDGPGSARDVCDLDAVRGSAGRP